MKLTINEYQPLTQRTLPDLGDKYRNFLSEEEGQILSDKLNLSHMAMGIVSELSEIHDAISNGDPINVYEEYADVMWYISNYCNLRKLNLENIVSLTIEGQENKGIAWYICELTDLVKKFFAYNKAIDSQKEIIYLRGIVFNILEEFPTIDHFEKALFNNIEKLRVRYPEKFTEENAINRNLEEERKTLEK